MYRLYEDGDSGKFCFSTALKSKKKNSKWRAVCILTLREKIYFRCLERRKTRREHERMIKTVPYLRGCCTH